MLRLLVAASLASLTLTGGCQRKSPPPPPPETVPRDAGVAVAPVSDAASVQPVYRTAQSDDDVDPALVGAGKTYMVVSEAEQASAVGKQILAKGGNAVDAAIATAFALAVVHPTAGNIAGGGFAVVRVAPGKAVALDFRETAPAAASPDMYLDEKGNAIKGASTIGHKASGVPGSVAGLWELHKKLGKLKWHELVEPAVKLARDGFTVDAGLAKAITRRADFLLKYPATAEIWVPNRIARAEGATVTIPLLAVALERIRDQGPDGFYKGETAKAIADEMKKGGGLITMEDLAGYSAVWREPLKFPYRGHTVISMPPPSSGGIVLAMVAGMLKHIDLGALPWHGVDHVRYLVETWRRAYAARNELLGDPTFVKDMPLAKLLSQPYLDKLAATITDRATPSAEVKPLLEGDHTTNLCVVDGSGMAIALTTTLNTAWGSGVTVHGFLMNNEMDDFAVKPGTPNTFGLVQWSRNKIEPGKRMLSSMTPTIVERGDGEIALVVGAQGGPRIITAVWQTMSNILDYKLTAGPAIAMPRIHHQHLPDRIDVQAESIEQPVAEELARRGYKVDYSVPFFGAANVIVKTEAGWAGAADPRGGGSAMGDGTD